MITLAFLLTYSVTLFVSIIGRQVHRLDQNLVDLKYSGFEGESLGDFLTQSFTVFYFELDLEFKDGFKSCNDIEFQISYKNKFNYTFPAHEYYAPSN
jgi:hypothetical protein